MATQAALATPTTTTTIRLNRHDLLALSANRIILRQPLKPLLTRPIFKWAGGKQWLAPGAHLLTPISWTGRYVEPFLGGGAIFFALKPGTAVLADSNADLITAYRAVRTRPAEVLRLLRRYPNTQRFYTSMRKRRPRTSTTRAARLIYLIRTGWNGLYRVNTAGHFNTPFGNYANPGIHDPRRLYEASIALDRAQLLNSDFLPVIDCATKGDLLYCDPPYITGHANNGFVKYNASVFSWHDQNRLADAAHRARGRGVHVLVSNAAHPSIRALYPGFFHYRVRRPSRIAASVLSRGIVTEALISSYQLCGLSTEAL